MSNKKSNLESKKVDPVAANLGRFFEQLVRNSRSLLIAGGSLVIASLAYLGVQAYMDQQSGALGEKLVAIEAVFNDEIEANSEKIEKLEDELDALKLKKEQQKSDETAKEGSKDLDSQIAKIEADIEKTTPNHEKSEQAFKEFYEENIDNSHGWVAGVRYAALKIENKQFDEAKKVLSQIVGVSKPYKLIFMQSSLLMVRILEEKGASEEAMNHVDKLMEVTPDSFKPALLLTKGRLHLLAKQSDQAIAVFDDLEKNFADSAEASRAAAMRALLY